MRTVLAQLGFMVFGTGLALMIKQDIFLYPATWATSLNLPTQLEPNQVLGLGFGLMTFGSLVLGGCLSEPKVVVDVNKK